MIDSTRYTRPDCIDAGPILAFIEKRLAATSTPPSRFGRQATGDPRFVFDLRRGRRITRPVAYRVLRFLDAMEARHG
ncbi:hypothetical protein [Caenibius sp. WL]|uniref:hypothetical protein n=1 Tax=Caenibius sp. WL TaxID=2872646 RepID=UPI001C9A2702|nr:hypothetical protein [Caenibius sp. WL]QZP08188.1 hypothetical protein K5X80_16405 [Caenibius sp. WL]